MASNANKRERRKRRAEPQDEPEFQVAPMIDVLLVLTLFFMSITSTELLKKEKNITLPDANHAKKVSADQQHGQITINVTWDRSSNNPGFFIDGRPYPDAPSLQSYLQPRASDPRAYALIRADKDVQYSNISDVMAACAAAGLSKVSFAVITSGNQQHHGAQPAPAPTPGP
jgi:biopolymer transport protein ExbD